MDRMNETSRNSKTQYARNGLTKDEINELKAAFDLFDIKGEGYIDAKELKATMESLEMQSKNKMVYNIIESIPNGRLNFDQFLDMMTTRIANTDSQDDIYKVRLSSRIMRLSLTRLYPFLTSTTLLASLIYAYS